MKPPIRIAPSILASDFGRLAAEVQAVERAGADWIHVDVMDGHFVPNLTIGPAVLRAVRRATALPLDVHLMIEAPERSLADYASAGAYRIGVHVETCPHLHRTVQQIHGLGKKACVVLNPATPAEAALPLLADVDQVLVMSVNPGFGGQSFIDAALRKIERLRRVIDASGRDIRLEVDGGVKVDNIRRVAAAGADTFVAGSAIFGKPDYKAVIDAMRGELAR